MRWIKDATDRTAGALRGALDAARGTTYQPLEGRSEATSREQAVYERWQQFRPARNAYERAAYRSLPAELEAEMQAWDRGVAEQWAREDAAARAAGEAEQDAREWETARGRWEAEHGQEAGR